jgi:eukaryotic-like serine/threonine-protein kinase
MSDEPDFPIGARLAGRDFEITERLAGERWRGRFRGRDRAGASVLVTIGGRQTEKASRLRRELELASPGIAGLRYIGQVVGESGGGAFDGMVEDEPPGQPADQPARGLTPRAGLELGISLGHIVARAHASGLVVGCLHPELIYLVVDAGRVTCAGVAPRAERFLRTATQPDFGLPDLFASEYRAPEELADGSRSMAGDVFAVSALSIEWVSGQFPFQGDMYIQRALAVQMYQRRPMSLSPLVQQFLERGLDRDPARRPSMQDWLAAAEAVKAAL